MEELARADVRIAITSEAAVGQAISPIHRFGTDDQKRKYLPELCAGKRLWAFGLTEAQSGTDAGAGKTRARLEAGEGGINGSKAFITNSGAGISWGVPGDPAPGDPGDSRPAAATL